MNKQISPRWLGSLCWIAMAVLCVVPSVASAGDTAAAQELFERALKLLDEKKWDEACPKFRASMDLEPSMGTLLNIGKCHEHYGKLASAVSALQRALDMNRATRDETRRKAVDKYTRDKMAKLKPRVPRLTIQVDPRPEGLEVTRSGKPVPLSTLGEALPVDPGTHEIVAKAPGFAATKKLTIAEGSSVEANLQLVPIKDSSGAAPAPDSAGVPTWAWVVGGVGVALGVATAVFSVDYVNTVSELEEICQGDLEHCVPVDDPQFDASDHNARKNRDMALAIAFGIGAGAALTAAIVGVAIGLSADGPGKEADAGAWHWRVRPVGGPTGGGLVVGVTF